MPKPNFFQELKRRNVYRVAITYAVVAWLLIQVASVLLPTFEAPLWVMKTLTLILAIGFPIALVLAWAFEMSPEGIIRTTSSAAEDNPLPGHRKKPLTSNVVIGVLLLIIGAQFLYSRIGTTSDQEIINSEKSIAVLPFDNMTGD